MKAVTGTDWAASSCNWFDRQKGAAFYLSHGIGGGLDPPDRHIFKQAIIGDTDNVEGRYLFATYRDHLYLHKPRQRPQLIHDSTLRCDVTTVELSLHFASFNT